MEFNCITDCSNCCVEREYYPSKKFGKIGVLLLPEEKERVEFLAKKENLKVSILPRIGISNAKRSIPEKILAFQLMGTELNGNTCPFLDKESSKRSPHGGFVCKIYDQRPLACKAYPVIESDPLTLDKKCKFCEEHGQNADKNLNSEMESLVKIKNKMTADFHFIFRYATGIGEESDKEKIQRGWILEKQSR